MLRTADLMFGEWLPSRPDYQNPGCIVARNVFPTAGGYGPIREPVPELGALASGTCKGAAQFFGLSGTRVVVGGTSSSLFVWRGGSMSETYGLVDIGLASWDFSRFNKMIVATAPGNPPQYLPDLDTSTTWLPLPGSPPTARCSERVSDFLMLGDVDNNPSRVHWSALNSPASDWTPNRRTQAGFIECPHALGAVVGITGGRFPLIFQERGVNRIEYVGPSRVWHRAEVEQARGCLAPGSIVQLGFIVYYLGGDGFYATDGSQFQPISTGRVTGWFFEDARPSRLSAVHGAIDWQSRCVVWAYHSRESNSDIFDRLLIYSWEENRWSHAEVEVARLLGLKVAGMTLEDIGALYPTLEEVPYSLDDPVWQGSERALGAFLDGPGEWAGVYEWADEYEWTGVTGLGRFAGDTMQATWETGEYQPMPGRRVFVPKARPLIDGNGAEVAAYARQNDRSGSYTPLSQTGPDGACPLRADGMTLRMVCRMPAGKTWSDAQGLQTTFRASGAR